ncbi:MAG: branched-chain amino acid ABC transporter permease [Candidatus Limiplasma sp.]|nr:branched-chain amino acid ABC transporter permease [Candidatus Limiplasma sp.]
MSDYLSYLIQGTCIAIIGVVSIFPLSGMTGLFSFGQAAYMAVGAYVAGILALQTAVPYWLCFVAGIVVSGLVAVIVGFPCLRLRRDYFSLMSLFLGEAITAVIKKFSAVTGGAGGISNIPHLVGLPEIIISTVLCIVIVASYKNSRYGRISLAIKTDELASKSFGINVFAHKMKVYVFTSMIAGFAGVLYAFYLTYLDPSLFGWTRSSEWLIFLSFGGVNSLTGSVLFTALLTLMPEVLRFASQSRIILYCVLILLVINFRPEGVMGEFELSISRIVAWVRRKGGTRGAA